MQGTEQISHKLAIPESYHPAEIESNVRIAWSESDIISKISSKLANKKPLGYVEGPPTLNGEPHMGHLRGRVIKDLWYRFETMKGNRIDFRGGWDCQGLPVELSAEKELGLSGNKTANLKAVGEEKLVETCKAMVHRYHAIWRETDVLLGLLMNDSKAYWTYVDEYIEREWQVLKSAWETGILSEGYRVTPYCPSCQTSLSAAEVALGGYETLEDPSMYFKMKVRESEATFLVLWTTMPFTLVTDELVGAKPDSDYHYVKVGLKDRSSEIWIVGAGRLLDLMKELRIDKYEIMKTVNGKELEGLRYEYPFYDLVPKQKEMEEISSLVHTVVAEEFVDVTTGSGLVHMSPANGEDDFEVSRRRDIPVYNPINDEANFSSEAGSFGGLFVRESDQKVASALDLKNLLLRYGKIRHEYPVCWRSGHRLVWLARREYFYFVDRLKDKAVDAANNVEYYFAQPKNRFTEIIKEKRPWCISRERVWGSPLPIWVCPKCKKKVGLFSRKEISSVAKSLPDGPDFELHRPWIDRIVIECAVCESDMKREPFVLDTWHNSGAAPFASLSDEEYKEYIPVPFLTEGIDQTRGWAYTLLIENVILSRAAESPYKSFLFMGHVLDERGQKLSKSKGNFVPVRELLSKYSVDLTRLYLMWKSGPIDSINFNQKEMTTRPYQILNTLYQVHVFYLQNSSFDKFCADSIKVQGLLFQNKGNMKKQDRWLLSRLQLVLEICTNSYSDAKYHEAARAIEQFVIGDLSQTYIPIVRGELWEEKEGSDRRRQAIYSTLAYVLLMCDRLLHPISPFLTEYLASRTFNVSSLILEGWPDSLPQWRDQKLEAEFDVLSRAISITNAARMKAKVKRRWPLRKAYYLVSEEARSLLEPNMSILLEQNNLSEIELHSDPSKVPIRISAKPNYEIVAPRAKSRMDELSSKLSKTDAAKLYSDLESSGKTKLWSMPDFELGPTDLIFSFIPAEEKYHVGESRGLVVALDSTRDEELTAEGLLRDLARNIQALRKEKGYNPTDVLSKVQLSRLGAKNVSMLEPKKSELAFLVRVQSVELLAESPPESTGWKTVDIDGLEVRIEIS